MTQSVLSFLPGYYWDGHNVQSTGVAIQPTQHVSKKTGEIIYYVKPIGWACSCYIRRNGIIDYLKTLD
jgi:hypothetical protein